MSVIDRALRFSQYHGVPNHDEILAELVRQLEAKIVKGKAVAALLGIAPPRVTEMRTGLRRIQPHEMAKLAVYLGLGELPSQETAEIIDIWDRIPAENRGHAKVVFSTFAKPNGREAKS